jgi:hypothetical protein
MLHPSKPGEPWGTGKTDPGHLGQAGAFAPEDVLHVLLPSAWAGRRNKRIGHGVSPEKYSR